MHSLVYLNCKYFQSLPHFGVHVFSGIMSHNLKSPYISPSFQILSAVTIGVEFQRAVISSGILFFFWFLHLLIGIIPFRSYILNIQYTEVGTLDRYMDLEILERERGL